MKIQNILSSLARLTGAVLITGLLLAGLPARSASTTEVDASDFALTKTGTISGESVTDISGVQPLADATYMLFVPLVSAGSLPVTTVTIPAGGGSADFAGGKITISVPAGAASGAITLKVSTPLVQPPDTMYAYGPAIDIQAFDDLGAPLTQLNKSVTLTFFYDQLNFLIWPSMRIYTKTAGGAWSYVPTEYVSGQKAVKATINHFSSYALFGANGYNYQRMAGDKSGNVYLMSSDGKYVYRLALGDSDPTLYGDLSSIIGYGSSLGDLTRDPRTGDLYIGNASTVYRLTPAKQLSTFYTLPTDGGPGDAVNGLHFSPSFNALFISAVYGTYQVDAASGLRTREIWAGTGSQDVVTDSNKRIFLVHSFTFTVISNVVIHPDIENHPLDDLGIVGFLGSKRLAVDSEDNIYVPNPAGNAISVVGGPDGVVTGAIRDIPGPSNVTLAGGSLVVATGGGLQVIPSTRRDPSSAKPKILQLPTISGKGSLVQIYGGDPIPAHNILRINGKVQRNLAGYWPGANTVAYNLDDAVMEPYYWTTIPLPAYTTPLYQAQVYIGDALALDTQLLLPEPGNSYRVDTYAETYLSTGAWGIFMSPQSVRVVSAEGIFNEWNSSANGRSLAYQFNQAGDFHFTTTIYGDATSYSRTVHVSAGGENIPGLGDGYQVDPLMGAIFRAYGASIEIPPAALPGTAQYKLSLSISDAFYAGKDAVTAKSYNYQFKLTPEPTSLLKDLTIRLPYDPSQNPAPVAGFMDPALSDVELLPFSLSDGKVVITLAAGNYSTAASAAAVSGPSQSAGIGSTINTILSGLWWAVGLPNDHVSNINFLINFNTGDCSKAYAQGLLADLQAAYVIYDGNDYGLPTLPILVKIAPWIAAGKRPGVTVGGLGAYHLFFNNAMSDSDRQDTAAHELFHVVQRESISPDDLIFTPQWWLDGTATWAQYLVNPGNTGYLKDVTAEMDFPNTSFNNWKNFNPEQQYATMALVEYLVSKNTGAIKLVNWNLNNSMSMQDALQSAVGEPWNSFYARWAKDYWMQTYAPVDTWNLGSAMQTLNPAFPSTNLTPLSAFAAAPALSSGLSKAFYDPATVNPPLSFANGVNSVVRMPNSCTSSEVYLFNKAKSSLGSFSGEVPDDNVGIQLKNVPTYLLNNPVYTLFINNGAYSCSIQVVWEAPTLTSVKPKSVGVNTRNLITLEGAGFGPNAGLVFADEDSGDPAYWDSTSVEFYLYPGGETGTIIVTVKLPGGAISNPLSIDVTP